MKAVKRLEIVIAARQMTQVCRLLEQHGVSGYTLIREVAGKGERGMQFADGLNAAFANSYLLTTCDPDVLPALVEALTNVDDRVRFEAAKALIEIHDPKAVPALIGALEDERSQIRWVAAEGLTRLGSASRGPLLHALIEHSDSVLLREGAHHILRCWARLGWGDEVGPVLAALEDIEPAVEVPMAAYITLKKLGE